MATTISDGSRYLDALVEQQPKAVDGSRYMAVLAEVAARQARVGKHTYTVSVRERLSSGEARISRYNINADSEADARAEFEKYLDIPDVRKESGVSTVSVLSTEDTGLVPTEGGLNIWRLSNHVYVVTVSETLGEGSGCVSRYTVNADSPEEATAEIELVHQSARRTVNQRKAKKVLTVVDTGKLPREGGRCVSGGVVTQESPSPKTRR